MDKVIVLLSSYNGEKYIKPQLESILNQKGVEVELNVRDDGSLDDTLEILKEYERKKKLKLIIGTNVGYRQSFLKLLGDADTADYYAFADQDDVWDEEKIIVAIQLLEREQAKIPLLYTSALRCVDSNLSYLRTQDFNNLRLGFYSEFVRHRFAGCTFVMNKKLHDLTINAYNIEKMRCPHDTFITLLCWSCGGKVIYDSNPHINFRRHGNNTSIDGMGKLARVKHEFAFLGSGRDYKFDISKMFLEYYKDEIAAEYRIFFNTAVFYKNNMGYRVKLLTDKRLDCGIWQRNLLFKLSILLNSV